LTAITLPCIISGDACVVKDTSKYQANRIIFDSDSEDDNEVFSALTQSVPDVQPDKRVELLFILLLTSFLSILKH